MVLFAKSLGEICADTAQIAAIPTLRTAATLVLMIVALAGDASSHKRAIKVLSDKCYILLCFLRDHETSASQPKDDNSTSCSVPTIVERVEGILQKIETSLQNWSKLKAFEKVVMEEKIQKEITEYHIAIDHCIKELDLDTKFPSSTWQEESERARKEDHKEIVVHLSELLDGQFLGGLSERWAKGLDRRLRTRKSELWYIAIT